MWMIVVYWVFVVMVEFVWIDLMDISVNVGEIWN